MQIDVIKMTNKHLQSYLHVGPQLWNWDYTVQLPHMDSVHSVKHQDIKSKADFFFPVISTFFFFLKCIFFHVIRSLANKSATVWLTELTSRMQTPMFSPANAGTSH